MRIHELPRRHRAARRGVDRARPSATPSRSRRGPRSPLLLDRVPSAAALPRRLGPRPGRGLRAGGGLRGLDRGDRPARAGPPPAPVGPDRLPGVDRDVAVRRAPGDAPRRAPVARRRHARGGAGRRPGRARGPHPRLGADSTGCDWRIRWRGSPAWDRCSRRWTSRWVGTSRRWRPRVRTGSPGRTAAVDRVGPDGLGPGRPARDGPGPARGRQRQRGLAALGRPDATPTATRRRRRRWPPPSSRWRPSRYHLGPCRSPAVARSRPAAATSSSPHRKKPTSASPVWFAPLMLVIMLVGVAVIVWNYTRADASVELDPVRGARPHRRRLLRHHVLEVGHATYARITEPVDLPQRLSTWWKAAGPPPAVHILWKTWVEGGGKRWTTRGISRRGAQAPVVRRSTCIFSPQ